MCNNKICNINTARHELKKYKSKENADACLEISDREKITDESANMIAKRLGIESLQDLQGMDEPSRNTKLKLLKDEGLSIRQLERLTEIGRGVILNA